MEFLKQHPCEESNDVRQVTSVVKTYTFTVEAVTLVDYRSIAWTIAQSNEALQSSIIQIPGVTSITMEKVIIRVLFEL